jgi:c(7)-type cytochrome triheme protein
MMNILKRAILFAGCAAALMASSSHAVPPGLMREFQVKGMGNVVFSGRLHAERGLTCGDCHSKIFKPELGGNAITMDDITQGRFCGTCHNGKKAFKAGDSANCKKCHKK